MKSIKYFAVLAIVVGVLVGSPQLTAKVVKAEAFVTPANFTGPCPKRFEFAAKITVDKPGVVKYKWIRSDNAQAPLKTLVFKSPGTQKVTSYWQLSAQGTHWKAVQVLAPNRMTSNKAVFKLKCAKKTVKPMVARPGVARPGIVKPGLIKPGTLTRAPIGRSCPDPAAHEIRFQIVRRDTQFKGRIRITGVVKNVGGKPFICGPNQAKAYLYELPPGVPPATATGGRIVAQKAIRNLPAGAFLLLTYERDWNSSSPSEGEFPNSYRLLITYDPDIYMDANKNNDDCNQGNNKKNRSGTEINDMLR